MGRNLYWTDEALGTLSVARLDAPAQRRVLVRDDDYQHYHPRAIALHPANGTMYWSVWAGRGAGGGGAAQAGVPVGAGAGPGGAGAVLGGRLPGLRGARRLQRRRPPHAAPRLRDARTATHFGAGLDAVPAGVAQQLGGAGAAAAPRPPPCPPGTHACLNGSTRCLEPQYVCDGDRDCADGSDEDSAPGGPCANVTCAADQFMRCDTNRCIPNSWVCDGQKDCNDGADEAAAACSRAACRPQQFQCAASRRCIPLWWRCDGAPDCADGADEADRCGLCVDVDADRLYWVNSGSSTIQYIDVATGKVTTLDLGRGARPTALEVYGDTLVWADAGDAALRACDKLACAAGSARVLRNNTEGVVALRVYDAALQRGAPGPCARRARPCAHLCLPVSEHDSECRCAAGYDASDTACIAVDEVLVYSLSWELRGAALQEPEPEPRALLPPVPQLSVASAIDYDA
ncbi:hypothetical protein B5X24_HaOG214171, partial [Helicoverpa armigera]